MTNYAYDGNDLFLNYFEKMLIFTKDISRIKVSKYYIELYWNKTLLFYQTNSNLYVFRY